MVYSIQISKKKTKLINSSDRDFPKIPADWNIKKIKEITIKVGSGSTPEGGKENFKSSGISFLRSQNIYDYFFK